MIAEVAEAQAEGRVAAVYADIRQVLGVPFVNLIYRHLATTPAVLDCVWAALRPHFASGELAAQAARLRREIAAQVEGWPVACMEDAPEEARAAASLVGMYNEANSLNRVALQHLLGPCRVQAAAPQADPAQADAPADLTRSTVQKPGRPAIPRLPEFRELQQRELDRIHRLNAYAEPGTPAMVASLYRHLAAWPDVLREVERVLGPLNERGLLDRAREDACIAAARCAQAQPLAMAPLVDAFHSQYEARLRQFADVTISKMIPIGMALSRAFGPPRSHPE